MRRKGKWWRAVYALFVVSLVGALGACEKRKTAPPSTAPDAGAPRVASGGSGLDPEAFTLLHQLTGHELGVESLAFDRHGKMLASGSYDKTVRIWDLANGKVTRTFTGHDAWVPTVAFHPKDSLVASGSGDKQILVNRYNKKTKPIEIKEHNGVHCVSFDPEGEHIASAGFGGGLRLWHLRSGDWRRTFKGHTSDVYAVVFSPDGKLLASGSADQTIRIWDRDTAKELRVLEGHTDWVLSLTFNTEGTILRSVGRDGSLRTWEVAEGRPLTTHGVTDEPIHAADFSPDGRLIAVSSGKQVKLLSAAGGEVLRRFPAQPKSVTAVVWSPDGMTLAWGVNDGSIQVWRAKGE